MGVGRVFVRKGQAWATPSRLKAGKDLPSHKAHALPPLAQVAVESQMKNVARPMYSNPPLHGALLVSKILSDKALKAQWYQV